MLKKTVLGLCLAGAMLGSAQADTGPYYLAPQGFCNIYQVYLSTDGYIYGKEVGCSSSVGQTRAGFYAGSGNKFTIATPSYSGSSPDGGVVILVYDLAAKTRTRTFSDGSTLTRSETVPFTLSSVKPSNALASALPDENPGGH